ncbi:helix-turn-helix transcriptional regulator [Actinomadura sp. ATCC 31491]|uniref:Helix-turn-helix transcriptional regulator n=1 Tax=Actinomadura luzonensis TaxID=2805427 RepID=A0ABT0FTT3_9ACTN|nr:helix-turn-helix transcriptional regulator [Actinomadura luzonensis]MCK2215740.1 helix-turn-helix transcriptional regulator [Actinomadura luzonensis]
MSTAAAPDRAIHELRTMTGRGVAAGELGAAISAAIAPWVGHDALRLVGTSPATGLGQGSFSFWHRYEEELVRSLLAHRSAHGDPCRPSSLAGRRVPVGVAGPAIAARGTAFAACGAAFAACGAAGELRLLLRDERGVWGLLGLVRAGGARPFSPDDVRRAVQLGPALIALLRRHVTAGPLAPVVPALPAGLIVVDAGRTIRAVTPQARVWLDLLSGPDGPGVPPWLVPALVTALALDARENARAGASEDVAGSGADVLAGGGGRALICAPPAGFGRWLMMEAQTMDADGAGDVAVVIQSPAGALVLPSFCDWYGLTPRERQVLELLCRGAAPKQVARALGLSAYTVNDHLKALFRKTGAGGRDELMAAFTA